MVVPYLFTALLLVVGTAFVRRSRALRVLNFPGALVGGAVGSALVMALPLELSTQLRPSTEVRDLLLIIFYIAAGLEITVEQWRQAGKVIIPLTLACIALILVQNVLGIAVAELFSLPTAYGVLSGGIAYMGGHGSAVAWGEAFEVRGVPDSVAVGVTAATLGIISSSLVAGPYVAFILSRNRNLLQSPEGETLGGGTADVSIERPEPVQRLWFERGAIIVLVLISYLGGLLLQRGLHLVGVVCPEFLTAMLSAIGISLLFHRRKLTSVASSVQRVGDGALGLFLVMTLTLLNPFSIERVLLPLLVIGFAQTVMTVVFCYYVFFRFRGGTFESLTLSGGVIGFGLGSFASAMATLREVQRNYGGARESVVLVTLLGGAVSNIANAVITFIFFSFL